MRRILLLNSQMEPAGAQNVMLNLAGRLPRDRFGVYPACLYTKVENPLAHEFGLEVIDFQFKILDPRTGRYRMRFLPVSLYGLLKFMKLQRIDIAHTFDFYANVLGAFVAAIARIPGIVVSMHNVYEYLAPWQHVLHRVVSNYLADRVVAVSEKVRAFEVEKERIDPQKIVLIHNAVDLRKFDCSRRGDGVVRELLGVGTGEVVVVGVGRLSRLKAHDVLLRAHARAVKRCGRLRLVLVGDGEKRGELERLARDLGVERYVRFLGWQGNVSDILRCADIFVQPSLVDGFGIAALEAMASGVPVILSDAVGLSELLVDGEQGVVVPRGQEDALAEAMVALALDKNERIRVGQEGRRVVERKFDIRVMVESYERVYDSLVGGGRIPGSCPEGE